MPAATRASAAEALRALDDVMSPGLISRLRGSKPDALGAELLAAARALASSAQLNSVLTDPGVDDRAKTNLVKSVFGVRFERAATDLLGRLVASRWSTPADLVDTVEELGFRALASHEEAEDLEAQLFAVERAVASEPQLELALGNTAAPASSRELLVDRLLANASEETRSIVRHVVELPRGRRVREALERAERIVAAQRGRLVAVATVARPLTEEQLTALEERLTTRYGRTVAVNQVVDPALLGGVRIQVGDDVIDGTVRARLDGLRLQLA